MSNPIRLGPPVRRDGVLPEGTVAFNFAVLLDGCPIGVIGHSTTEGTVWLHGRIAEDQRRRGYATAAMRLLIDRLRRDGVSEVHAMIRPHNTASRAWFKGLGFTERAVTDENVFASLGLSE